MKIDLTSECLFDSKTLFNEMALLNANAVSKATRAFQFIYDNGIRGVLIGGMAVSHWTIDRKLTPDVDFMTNDFPKLLEILKEKNIAYKPLASIKNNFDGIMVPMLDADFIDASRGNLKLNNYIIQTAHKARVGGLVFNIIDPSVQTIMKFDVGRDKDMEDAFNLIKSKAFDKMGFRHHLKNLKDVLSGETSAKEIWSYVQALKE